jgi:subtilisin family serine protease
MSSLDLVKLTALMDRTRGSPEISIGLIDGPVARDHPDLAESCIREIRGGAGVGCQSANSLACLHGTFVAGILSARRGAPAPAICPECILLVRPLFGEGAAQNEHLPSANANKLAVAILDCIEAGARVINLSLALAQPSMRDERALKAALDHAIRRGVVIVAAAGNQNTLGSTAITRHPWVIPVVAYDRLGQPLAYSNFGISIGRRGLGAPGDRVVSLSSDGQAPPSSGTSVATPFITGTIALLWSMFPAASAQHVKLATTQGTTRRTSVVPPLLDAWAAYQMLAATNSRRFKP